LWRGDNAGCAERASRLSEQAIRYRHGRWQPYAEWYGALASRLTNRDAPVEESVTEPAISAVSGLLLDTILTVNPEASVNDDAALVRGGLESWCAAELLRRQATRLLIQEGVLGKRRAETLLLSSLDLARGQNALSWELRSASSLATLWETEKRYREAVNLLSGVYARFTEGHHTEDLRQANTLLHRLDILSRA